MFDLGPAWVISTTFSLWNINILKVYMFGSSKMVIRKMCLLGAWGAFLPTRLLAYKQQY